MSSAPTQGHTAARFEVTEQGRVHIGDIHNHADPTVGSKTPPSRFRNKYFEVPRNPSSIFTGREEIGEQLRSRCLPSSKPNTQQQQKRFVIHGLGGSGKTQICLKFAEDHREEFWGIFWLDASSVETLERGYLQVAEVCGLDARVSVVQRWLSNASEPWALILDNADDPCLDISAYFPVGNRGVVLITTRNPECKLYSTVGSYELGAMATDEAVTLLLETAEIDNRYDESTRTAAKAVVRTLGHLALAISQAGAVIRQNYCKIEEYCALYSSRRRELLSQRAIQGGEDYRYTVYTTWEVSRQTIEKMSSEDGQNALALLRMFSFFHYESISEEIFYYTWRSLHKQRQPGWIISHQLKMLLCQSDQEYNVYPFRAAISILRAFSLIHRDKNDLISIHPLVHSWTRDQMSASEEDMMWRQATTTIALSILWTFKTTDFQFRRSMMPHIDACLGLREDGVFSLQSIGDEFQETASAFAFVYREVGRIQKALELEERVVEARRRTLGEEHRDTLRSIHNLAIGYSETGRQQEALELRERVVEARRRTLGEEHPDTLGSIHNLALSYSKAGRRQEALQLRERVIDSQRRTLGEEHPNTISSIHNLALIYATVGRRQEALQLMKQVVEVRKRILGEEHPDTLIQ
ncbi:MAG: hypothetical protein Q9190_004209 [Brigantiaea leucoxantha]